MILEEVKTEGNNLSHSFDDWILNQNQLGKFRDAAYVCNQRVCVMAKQISTNFSFFYECIKEVISVSGRCDPSIPTQISKMTNLWSLDASNCDFGGTLPSSIGELTQLGKWYHTAIF
jgi:hypothetical protein